MRAHHAARKSRGRRHRHQIRPDLFQLEQRVVLSYDFTGINGIALDTSGDLFISYNSTGRSSTPQESVAELAEVVEGNDTEYTLVSSAVFSNSGANASPGALSTLPSSSSLPFASSSSDILELQPDGQLFVFDPTDGSSSQVDDLANYTPNESNVYNVQTGASGNLGNQINLANAKFGDFGIYENSLVVSGVSNNLDFIMRVTYGSSSNVATILVDSSNSGGPSASPPGVAVDFQGTVLTTLPDTVSGSTNPIDVPVGFSLF